MALSTTLDAQAQSQISTKDSYSPLINEGIKIFKVGIEQLGKSLAVSSMSTTLTSILLKKYWELFCVWGEARSSPIFFSVC